MPLARNRRRMLAGVIVAAAIVRAVYFIQLNATPLIEMYRWDQSDMNYYDAWAHTVASGDWLSRTIGPPMHLWQRQVADQYLDTHPGAAGGDAERALWMQWMRTPRFYQDPLYIYAAAAVYVGFTAGARTMIALQLALGVASVVLVWAIALRYFGDAVALCAAAMAVLCAPLVFYEGLLLRESLVVFAGLLIVWLIDRPRPFLLGVVCGLAALLKSTFVLVPLIVVAAYVVISRPQRRKAMMLGGAVLAGFACGVLPLAARNSAVGVAPLSLAGLGPLTFVASNSVTANPDAGWEINPPQLAAFLSGTDGSLATAVKWTLSAHTPGSYARLLWRKWDRIWHWFEIPNNENLYYAARQVPLLRWLPITFWAISPLALVGLVLGARTFRSAWPLYVMVAFSIASLVGFLVVGRQRVPLLAALIPFASLTVVEIGRRIQRRQFAAALPAIAAVVLLGLWTGRAPSSDQFVIRTADWLLPFSVRYQHDANDAIQRQQWSRAASIYEEYFTRDAPTAAEIAGADDPTLAATLANMHVIRADFRVRADEDPADEFAAAEGLLRASNGRLASAGSSQDAVRVAMDQASARLDNVRRQFEGALNRRAVALADAGRVNEAVDVFRRITQIDPQNSHAHFNLARAFAAEGDLRDALGEAEQAEALSPDDPAPQGLVAQLERALKQS